MSLSTFIGSSLSLHTSGQRALVLMGGGARTAYQAGVLKALGEMLAAQPGAQTKHWPLPILVGTSAGALNCAYLASRTHLGLGAFAELAAFWQGLRSERLYSLNVPVWMRSSRLLTALGLSRRAATLGGLLDNLLLVDSLHKAMNLERIEANLRSGNLQALAVTASSYSSGLHWTFCQRSPGSAALDTSPRAGRRLREEPITIDHLAASSAIPGIFPAASLFVDGQREFFGDGSMRQSSPLSAPLKLGATHVLAIGVGQPDRASLAGSANQSASTTRPTLGMVAGHAMASVFHDTLRADVEQAQRVNNSLQKLTADMANAAGYRPVQVLQISPSQSLDAVAIAHFHELPKGIRHVLAGVGAKGASGAALASYLLFEPGFVHALMQMGERDAYAHKSELLNFFAG
jgi:NTE family protein